MSSGRFSLSRLSLRGVSYHRRSYAYVLLSAATATSVIVGALLVGDSVQHSLAMRVQERLGRIDMALVAGRFFREALAGDFESAGGGTAVPVILLEGTVVHAETRRRAGSVNVIGAPRGFWSLWGEPGGTPPGAALGLEGRRALLNATLAAAVQARQGESVLLYFDAASDISPEYAFGRRGQTLPPLRLEVAALLPDAGLAVFDLDHGQRSPANVFVPIDVLARALGKEGLANVLLIDSPGGGGAASQPVSPQEAMARAWTLGDSGLRLRAEPGLGYISLESRDLLLAPAVVRLVRELIAAPPAALEGVEVLEVLTYLANDITIGEREIPYSTVSAVGEWTGVAGLPTGPALEGHPIASGGIVLDGWAAEDLGASPGELVSMRYYVVGPDHRLEERATTFTLQGILPLEGAVRDPGWTPEYPGISDARSLRDWDPPFPVDMRRIREKDERYWDEHRAAPKAFVSIEDGRRLWASRFGDLTSLRFRAPKSAAVADLASRLEEELRSRIRPGAVGAVLRPVRDEGLDAARGATDFGGLFLALSFFLIASALILLGMVFRLACESRARELGVLAAAGFPASTLLRVLGVEGVWVVLGGTLGGLLGGVGYGAFLIHGLRTWWSAAVGGSFLRLHVGAGSLAIGGLITCLLSGIVTALVALRVSRAAPRNLLAGGDSLGSPRRPRGRPRGRRALFLAASGALLGLLLPVASRAGLAPEAVFFVSGACWLISGLLVVGFQLQAMPGTMGRRSLLRLGLSYAGRSPGRSLVTVALIASATLVITTVSASRRQEGSGLPAKDSGDGGFALMGRSAVPLTVSLGDAGGRAALGLGAETDRWLGKSRPFALRLKPGDDASCLNLYRPRSPRVLGAPLDFRERGGFAWAASLSSGADEEENPWRLLERDLGDGVVPAVGDANTVRWILHSRLGGDVTILDDKGHEVKLRIVALLSESIFQGELIIGEERFLQLFPGSTGNRVFLFDTPPRDAEALAAALEADLEPYGMDIDSTAAVLAGYRAVANTYLSTFQFLGGLGLLFGTLGLGAVLSRNVHERRAELALLRALGFSRGALATVILCETAFLLVAGLVVGSISAAIPLVHALSADGGSVAGTELAASLIAVFLAGLASSTAALRTALRAPLLPALRAE